MRRHEFSCASCLSLRKLLLHFCLSCEWSSNPFALRHTPLSLLLLSQIGTPLSLRTRPPAFPLCTSLLFSFPHVPPNRFPLKYAKRRLSLLKDGCKNQGDARFCRVQVTSEEMREKEQTSAVTHMRQAACGIRHGEYRTTIYHTTFDIRHSIYAHPNDVLRILVRIYPIRVRCACAVAVQRTSTSKQVDCIYYKHTPAQSHSSHAYPVVLTS